MSHIGGIRENGGNDLRPLFPVLKDPKRLPGSP